MKNEIDSTSFDKRFDSLSRGISDAAYFFLDALDKKNTHIEIYLVNNGQIRKLNNEYRGDDAATNGRREQGCSASEQDIQTLGNRSAAQRDQRLPSW